MNLAGFRVDISVRDLALAVSVSKATVETAVKGLMVVGLIC
jgi:predicted transcriptional regulator